jgi:hypothetical protein
VISSARDLDFRVGGEFLKATQNSRADHRRHTAKHRAPRFGDGALLELCIGYFFSSYPGLQDRCGHPATCARQRISQAHRGDVVERSGANGWR